MKKNIEKCLDFTHQMCWVVSFFIVLFYVKSDSAKNVNLKPKGEYRIDSTFNVPLPCESPATMSGYENDSIHISAFSAPGRKIHISIFKKDFKENKQLFLGDTCCRDSLAYSYNISKLESNECIRLVSNLYDCKDSLLSKKVVIFYNKNFLYSNYY